MASMGAGLGKSSSAAAEAVSGEVEFDESSRTGLMYNAACELHRSEGHVERPERVIEIKRQIMAQGLAKKLKGIYEGREATRDELVLTHDSTHVDRILGLGAAAKKSDASEDSSSSQKVESSSGWLDADTYWNQHSRSAALLAAGGLIDLCSRVCSDELDNGFAVARPPGHHCEKGKAMGFCLFNNVAVAVNAIRADERFQAKYRRFLVVDWDVHHGNGTQHLFEDDPNVLYFSIHRFDHGFFYPRTGGFEEMGSSGTTVNVPLNTVRGPRYKMHGSLEFLYAWRQILLPLAREFAPDLIVVSAGFDAVVGDPLGGLDVIPTAFGEMTALLQSVCPKVVMSLEGGYNLQTTPCAAVCVLATLIENNGTFDETKFEDSLLDKEFWKKQWHKFWTDSDKKLWNERRADARFQKELGFVAKEWVAKVPKFVAEIEKFKKYFSKHFSCFREEEAVVAAAVGELTLAEITDADVDKLAEEIAEVKIEDSQ